MHVQTDDIYPVHMLDDTKTLRDIVVTWTLRFNDVLDPDKLQTSLSRLLEIGDWRKIGGRLRLNVITFLLSLNSRLTRRLAVEKYANPLTRIKERWRYTSPNASQQNALPYHTATKS